MSYDMMMMMMIVILVACWRHDSRLLAPEGLLSHRLLHMHTGLQVRDPTVHDFRDMIYGDTHWNTHRAAVAGKHWSKLLHLKSTFDLQGGCSGVSSKGSGKREIMRAGLNLHPPMRRRDPAGLMRGIALPQARVPRILKQPHHVVYG